MVPTSPRCRSPRYSNASSTFPALVGKAPDQASSSGQMSDMRFQAFWIYQTFHKANLHSDHREISIVALSGKRVLLRESPHAQVAVAQTDGLVRSARILSTM